MASVGTVGGTYLVLKDSARKELANKQGDERKFLASSVFRLDCLWSDMGEVKDHLAELKGRDKDGGKGGGRPVGEKVQVQEAEALSGVFKKLADGVWVL